MSDLDFSKKWKTLSIDVVAAVCAACAVAPGIAIIDQGLLA